MHLYGQLRDFGSGLRGFGAGVRRLWTGLRGFALKPRGPNRRPSVCGLGFEDLMLNLEAQAPQNALTPLGPPHQSPQTPLREAY